MIVSLLLLHIFGTFLLKLGWKNILTHLFTAIEARRFFHTFCCSWGEKKHLFSSHFCCHWGGTLSLIIFCRIRDEKKHFFAIFYWNWGGGTFFALFVKIGVEKNFPHILLKLGWKTFSHTFLLELGQENIFVQRISPEWGGETFFREITPKLGWKCISSAHFY